MMILNITLVHTQKPKLHSSSGIPTLHSLHPDLPPWIVCVSLKIKSGMQEHTTALTNAPSR